MPLSESSAAVAYQREYYTSTAAKYDQMHLMDAEHNEALGWVDASLRRLRLNSILDLGCGTGRGVKYLLDRGYDAHGVEPVEGLLDSGCIAHDIPRDRVQVGSGEKLPYGDKSFDACVELGVLHHVPEPRRVVDEMIRVTRRAILLSDCNRFGQGRFISRLIKVAVWKCGLWQAIDRVRTGGKGYMLSKEDGLSYSYSVYDSFNQLSNWADRITVLPTTAVTSKTWFHPLLSASHVLLIAERNSRD